MCVNAASLGTLAAGRDLWAHLHKRGQCSIVEWDPPIAAEIPQWFLAQLPLDFGELPWQSA